MKPSQEVLSNGKGYERRNGWGPYGYTLILEPDSPTGRIIAYGRERLHHCSLMTLRGEAVTAIASRQGWTPEKIEDNPSLVDALLQPSQGNRIAPEEVTVEMHSDNRRGATVLYGPLPILEYAGVEVGITA